MAEEPKNPGQGDEGLNEAQKRIYRDQMKASGVKVVKKAPRPEPETEEGAEPPRK